MRTKIQECNGQFAAVRFTADNEAEEKILALFKRNQINDSIQLTVTDWVEKALRREVGAEFAVLELVEVRNNIYFIFKVERITSLGGY
jgi:hypothetical protein